MCGMLGVCKEAIPQSMKLFDDLVHSPLGFWLIASLIALLDSIIFLRPQQTTFQIVGLTSIRIRKINEFPYLLRGKEPLVTLIKYPVTPFYLCDLSQPLSERRKIRRALVDRRRCEAKLCLVSVLALGGLICIALAGPLLSLQYGVSFAILLTWPIVYGLAATTLIALLLERRRLELSKTDMTIFLIEFLLCPFLVVNIWKKLAMRRPMLNVSSVVGCPLHANPDEPFHVV